MKGYFFDKFIAPTKGGGQSWSSYWTNLIIASHKTINNHIPSDYYDTYYKPVLKEVLSPTYEDSEGIGYYYNTFGPNGLNKTEADFFLLFFIWGSWTADTNIKFSPATNVRLNVEGIIYNQATRPAHTYLGENYFIISNNNALNTISDIRWGTSKIHRYLPSFRYCRSTTLGLWLNGAHGSGVYAFDGDMTNYVFHQALYGVMQLQVNYLSGMAPRIYSTVTEYRIEGNYFTDIDIENSVISLGLITIYLYDNRIEGSRLIAFVDKLNTYYTAHTPTNNLDLNMGGDDMGVIEGELVEGVWQENASITTLRGLFTAAGKTLTLTYNSDEFSFGANIGILTFDDGAITDLTTAKPILDKYGVKGTFFITGTYVGVANYMTWAQITQMKNAGHDMQCHTYGHTDLTALDAAQLTDQAVNNNNAFIANSLDAPTITAYPLYKHNALVRSTFALYRNLCRAGGGAFGVRSFVFKDADEYALGAVKSV